MMEKMDTLVVIAEMSQVSSCFQIYYQYIISVRAVYYWVVVLNTLHYFSHGVLGEDSWFQTCVQCSPLLECSFLLLFFRWCETTSWIINLSFPSLGGNVPAILRSPNWMMEFASNQSQKGSKRTEQFDAVILRPRVAYRFGSCFMRSVTSDWDPGGRWSSTCRYI